LIYIAFNKQIQKQTVTCSKSALALDTGEIFQIACGEHQYPFSFVLPTEIPPSYEGRHGVVRYTLKAVLVNTSSIGSRHICKKGFYVNTIVDLNIVPNARVYNYQYL